MTTVVLANAYFYKLDAKQWRFHQPYPPLGTLVAAAVLRQAGFRVVFADMSLADGPQHLLPVLERERPRYVVVYDDGFNYLTKMCLTVMRDATFVMTRLARQYGAKVIVNSSDATDHYQKYLDEGVDYVIRGEGEETLRELLSGIESQQNISQVAGTVSQHGGQTHVNTLRPVLKDLDTLPLPAWDLVDFVPYRNHWLSHHGYFSLNLATTRGCPYKCNWCAKPIYGNRYNVRSPKSIVSEMIWLRELAQPDHYWMADDIFGLKPGWVRDFAAALKENQINIPYKIQSRADLLLEERTISQLSESGCKTVWIGAESGSQKILDAMDKGTTLAQIREATRQLRSQHIAVGYFLQFGYPGESREDIEATLQMVLDQMPDEIGISVSYPLPGTKFYERVKSELSTKQNWIDSDDLAMLYQSPFPPVYYKLLQRYVHSRFRIQRGIQRLKALPQQPKLAKRDLRKLASMVYHTPLSWVQRYRLNKIESGT
ncbi:MAG TPA: radical SAM protein [Cyclobacteriaceae bacterium]|nr:radical SAM protein [Cyclobacteriaceae bacterium]